MVHNETIALKHWKFSLEKDDNTSQEVRAVTIPHTWNIEEGLEDYYGTAWYSCALLISEKWHGHRLFLYFKAVYHSAEVYINNQLVGVHQHSGYTPFSIEITQYVQFGVENNIAVRVDNTFTEELIPYKRSYDWAGDGGIIRDVFLKVRGTHVIKQHAITAKPVIVEQGLRQDNGTAIFGATVHIDGDVSDTPHIRWQLYKGCDDKTTFIAEGEVTCLQGSGVIKNHLLQNIFYWHFDSPQLYTLTIQLMYNDTVQDSVQTTFGFRDFHADGSRFLLNGEYVRLCGTEWMPGSNPNFGMAETQEQLESMLTLLKESNCIFTRFHWQQDSAVFDWCDRHGMLVQEEVPLWGKDPKEIEHPQYEIAQQQLEEMISAHRNHPSIIAWGVGNELDAQSSKTIQYIKDALVYAHNLDDSRIINYVTNSIFENTSTDGVREGDVLMVNEYIGTWQPDLDLYQTLEDITKANPGKPLVPSEFGLCEPFHSGGDKRRIDIFQEKMEAYRRFSNIAGVINFSLNDYRTQIGEDGVGKLQQRVHGSVDIYQAIKPSYWVVQKEFAPLRVMRDCSNISIMCTNDIPAYEVKGYYIELPQHKTTESGGIARIEIPDLRPGELWKTSIDKNQPIIIYRKNGDKIGEY